MKVAASVCSDNNCTQPRAKNQIRCKDCRNQFQAFRSSVVRFYRNDACVPPSDSSCFRRFVKEKPQWVSRLSIVSCIIFIGEYLLCAFFSIDEHKLIVRSGLALVHVTCDIAFVGSRQLSCLTTSWVYQFFNEIWKMENRLWSSCRLTS